MEKDIIHENSNNHNKYINNENSGEKSAEQAGAVLRAMTVDDISAVKQIEQTCFSDAWSEKLLSDLLESEWDEAWVLTDTDGTRIGYANFRFLAGEGELMRIAVLPEHRGCGESNGPSGNLCKGKGSAGPASGGARRKHTCHKPL